ncbi:alpha/beta-Hydrolases superfamily protein [Rhynchospora pubera]|uniref:Alpha/beta-Hydrolases superfamily protein n=1 Tax=Rhynchospora pubera TaxID=906938 RepID=A0AAV8DTK3_9POAL|nr:alpha/beta-Hydrolases superfamily protein [Rhynchospora pubera]
MVNFVEAQKPLLHFLIRRAGLRQQSVEVEPGTVMSFWVPKDKATKKKGSINNEIVPEGKSTDVEVLNENGKKTAKERPAVVLVHGFAAEGIVTWQFHVGVLAEKYDVYVPDLLFFGESETNSKDRSPLFQAQCLVAALTRLGVKHCTVVGFSYGGMVAFKMAELNPDLVRSLVISGSVIAMTDSITDATLERLGMKSSAELLLPKTVKGLKALQSQAMYKKIWFPNFLMKDYLEVMFNHRKERAELLESLVISNKDATVPVLTQKILLLWGENDNLFKVELAMDMKEKLGEKATIQTIDKAGHLVHLERPCRYNRLLKEYLATVTAED